jgi:hypothetical protein
MSFSGFTDDAVATTVQNDGWWPSVTVGEFQALYRIPSEYQTAMVVDALRLAMAWANRQLAEWRAARQAEGYAALDAVPGEELDGTPVLVMYYRRALFCQAKGLLMPQFKTMLRRAEAKNEALESEETEDKFFQYAQQALADFLGRDRINVELI